MRSKFIMGLLLVWIPLLFSVIAEAGGMQVSRHVATFIAVALVAFEAYGVILLSETFSKGQFLRGFVAIVSIGCGVLLLIFLSLTLVFVYHLTSALAAAVFGLAVISITPVIYRRLSR